MTRTKGFTGTVLVLGAAGLPGACAPDPWKPSPGYDGFLDQVQKACYYQRIGTVEVGPLLMNPGSMQADYFIDQTSRLYFGKITRDNWASAVTPFLNGRADDPGVRCVLDQLDQAQPSQVPPPPPSR